MSKGRWWKEAWAQRCLGRARKLRGSKNHAQKIHGKRRGNAIRDKAEKHQPWEENLREAEGKAEMSPRKRTLRKFLSWACAQRQGAGPARSRPWVPSPQLQTVFPLISGH
jgi:hypothetical protein